MGYKMAEFDPDKYLQEKELESKDLFDPDKYLQDKNETLAEIRTFGREAGNVASFGHMPQIQAGVESLAGGDYTKRRDEIIESMKKDIFQNQKSAWAGKVAGIGGSLFVPFGVSRAIPAVANLPKLAQAGIAAGEGLGMMAAQNPGDTPGEVDPIQAKERLENITEHPVLSTIAAALPAVSGGLNLAKVDIAAEAAYKAIGPGKKALKEGIKAAETSPKTSASVGRLALDKGIVSPASSYEKMYDRSGELLKDTWNKISNIYSKHEIALENKSAVKSPMGDSYNASRWTPDNWKSKILSEAEQQLKHTPNGDSALKKIETYLDSQAFNGEKRLSDLQDIRAKLGNSVKDWSKSNLETPEVQQGFKTIIKNIDQSIDGQLEAMSPLFKTNERAALSSLRKDYSSAKVINNASLDNMTRKSSLAGPATMGTIAGAAGALGSGHIGVASSIAGLGLLGKAASQGRGKSFGASMINKLQEAPMSPLMQIPAAISSEQITPEKDVVDPNMQYQAPPPGAPGAMNMNQKLEGFPVTQTMSVADKARSMGGIDPLQVEMISRAEIEKHPGLSNMQKANRLNLLNKHGRVLLA